MNHASVKSGRLFKAVHHANMSMLFRQRLDYFSYCCTKIDCGCLSKLCIIVTPKCVLTQMKCRSITRQFIRVYIVCYDKKTIFSYRNAFNGEIITCDRVYTEGIYNRSSQVNCIKPKVRIRLLEHIG